MEQHLELCERLKEKRELLLSFERVTDEMLYEDDVEKLETAVSRRQELLEQMEARDEEIRGCCGGDTDWLRVLNHECDRNGLTAELAAVYDASLAVKSVASRIQNSEGAVVEHLEMAKAKLKEKIEEINGGGYAVASKYYRAAQTGILRAALDDRNKKV